ncbi:MAG: hypothetical protein WAW98_11005, partial [Trichococcus flocculiformis]
TTAKSLLNQITGKIVPVSSTIKAPFQTDFGRHIFVGENVFINTYFTTYLIDTVISATGNYQQ